MKLEIITTSTLMKAMNGEKKETKNTERTNVLYSTICMDMKHTTCSKADLKR